MSTYVGKSFGSSDYSDDDDYDNNNGYRRSMTSKYHDDDESDGGYYKNNNNKNNNNHHSTSSPQQSISGWSSYMVTLTVYMYMFGFSILILAALGSYWISIECDISENLELNETINFSLERLANEEENYKLINDSE